MELHILDGIVWTLLICITIMLNQHNDDAGVNSMDIAGRFFEYLTWMLSLLFFLFFIFPGHNNLKDVLSNIKFTL